MRVYSKENVIKRIKDLKGWEMKENTSRRSRDFSESLLSWLICLAEECSQSNCLLVHSANPNALLADKHQIRCLHWLTEESLKSSILKWGGDTILARDRSFAGSFPGTYCNKRKSVMHHQYTTHIKQDELITIRWYLATCFGRNRPSSGQLRTTIKVQWNFYCNIFLYLNCWT